MQTVTLKQILHFLTGQTIPLSAEEVAKGIGIARVTARRYLDYLEKNGQIRLDPEYGVGRLGAEKTKELFLWLKPGESPNYPEGVKDDNHFHEKGRHKSPNSSPLASRN